MIHPFSYSSNIPGLKRHFSRPVLQKTWQFFVSGTAKDLELTSLSCGLFFSTPSQDHKVASAAVNPSQLPSFLPNVRQDPPTHSSTRSLHAQWPQKLIPYLCHSTDHFYVYSASCPSPQMDKDLSHAALPFHWCCLLSSSKFDGKSRIPIPCLKTLASVKIHPEFHATQSDLAVLSVLNTRLDSIPKLMADFSLLPVTNPKPKREKANQLG